MGLIKPAAVFSPCGYLPLLACIAVAELQSEQRSSPENICTSLSLSHASGSLSGIAPNPMFLHDIKVHECYR